MTQLTRDERSTLAAKLRDLKLTVALDVTAEFFRRNPDWEARYGERGRVLCLEDECLHLEFLAGAMEGGSPGAFADYARWTAGVLASRGIAPPFLAQALDLIGKGLAPRLSQAEWTCTAQFLDVARAALAEGSPERTPPTAKVGLALTRELFLQALLQVQRKAACTIALEAVRARYPVTDVYVEVLQESLYEVGRLWESNRITVDAEHTATAIVQFVLAQLYPLLPASMVDHGNALVTGVEGELHQVGANMVADVLEASGWNVRFLGTNVPHACVLQAIQDHQAQAVGISVATLLSLSKVRRLVTDLREKFAGRCPRIVVGGRAFSSTPGLAAEIGADAWGVDLQSVPDLFTGKFPARGS